MSKPINCGRLYITGSFYIVLALGVLMVPLQWLMAWMISVTVHELGHLISLKLCGIEIESVEIGGFGAKIRTPPVGSREWICTLAGPCAGMVLVLFSRWIPRVAICAAVHSAFNLLPIYPLDGGRVIRCLLSTFLLEASAAKISALISTATIAVGVGVLFFLPDIRLRYFLILVLCMIILTRLPIKIPCKRSDKRVQ